MPEFPALSAAYGIEDVDLVRDEFSIQTVETFYIRAAQEDIYVRAYLALLGQHSVAKRGFFGPTVNGGRRRRWLDRGQA